MIKSHEYESLFDFVDNNLVDFMLESIYIGDRHNKAIAKRRFRFRLRIQNFVLSFFGIMVFIGGSIAGTWQVIDNRRLPAHACPDLQSEVKLIDKITKDVKKLQRALKQTVFNQKNGH